MQIISLPIVQVKQESFAMNSCGCTCSHGKEKNLYLNETLAQEQINYALKERAIELHMYPCPYVHGWHLTSNHSNY
jgi:hypothetical protein